MSTKPVDFHADHDAAEGELIGLVDEHSGERQALRALLHDFPAVLADADKAASRGFLRGVFSEGARALRNDEEGV